MTKGWLSWIRSNDKAIIDVLVEQAENLVKATSKLVELMTRYENITEYLSKISDMEHEGDEFVHKLFSKIHQSFVTPLDRQDISELTSSLDEILDYTHRAADRQTCSLQNRKTYFVYVRIVKGFAFCLSRSAPGHFTDKKSTDLIEHCHRISKYEHQRDKLYRNAVAELFDTNNPVEIIKRKEIYDTLEGALDRCADVAYVIEDISLKYT